MTEAHGPQLYLAQVRHARFAPKPHRFCYRVCYLAIPTPCPPLPTCMPFSFDPTDLGDRDGSDPGIPALRLLEQYGLAEHTERLLLITMPRTLGHVFNPVSFFLALDKEGALRGAVCEVHNTFGERHAYVCGLKDGAPFGDETETEAEKAFHVSPFFDRAGLYRFRFRLTSESFAVSVRLFSGEGELLLDTSLHGAFTPLTRASCYAAFFRCPFVSLKAVFLIHWNALLLFFLKRARFYSKPSPLPLKHTAVRGLTPRV